MGKVALVDMRTLSRRPARASPRISSDNPFEYIFAVSKRLTPASRQMSINRFASATSVLPQARKNSFPPPKVATPKLRTGTFNPEPPSCLYSIYINPYVDRSHQKLNHEETKSTKVLSALSSCFSFLRG